MSTEKNKAIVERIIEMFNGKGFEALDACVAETLVLHSDLVREPKGGIGDLRQLFLMVLGGFPEGKITVQEMTAEGNRVVVRFLFAGTHLGEIKGNAATGRRVAWQECMFFHFNGAKVEEIWHIINVMEVLEQLGVLPSEKVRARILQARTALAKLGRLTRFGR